MDNATENKSENNSKSIEGLVKFPKLEISNFYGDVENWNFLKLFTPTILNNKSLTDLEKLQYLQMCVKGTALKLIRRFSLKEENLTHSWQILCNRFDNKRQLALT